MSSVGSREASRGPGERPKKKAKKDMTKEERAADRELQRKKKKERAIQKEANRYGRMMPYRLCTMQQARAAQGTNGVYGIQLLKRKLLTPNDRAPNAPTTSSEANPIRRSGVVHRVRRELQDAEYVEWLAEQAPEPQSEAGLLEEELAKQAHMRTRNWARFYLDAADAVAEHLQRERDKLARAAGELLNSAHL